MKRGSGVGIRGSSARSRRGNALTNLSVAPHDETVFTAIAARTMSDPSVDPTAGANLEISKALVK